MRTWAYRSLIWLVAVAFVASGAVAQPCVAAQAQQPSALHAMHHSGDASKENRQHRHADASKTEPAKTAPAQSQVDHGCAKCCGLCTFVSIMPVIFEAGMARAASYNAYPIMIADILDWRGLPEPDIPKTLV